MKTVTLLGQTVRIGSKKWEYLTYTIKHANDLLSSELS